jgi:putative ABC transport system ATP-binding protein
MYIPFKPLFSRHKGIGVQFTDEPTGNLDSATTIEVMGLLKTSCRKYNQTILMVTHNEAIAQTCDRVIHIEDGQIVTGKRRFPAKGGDVVC